MSKKEIIYFASDFHLGIDAHQTSLDRERAIIRWLDKIEQDADQIFLVGDIFDFWFEYREVVPKGHFRLLAKLDQLVQRGIRIEIFTGNHDMWMFDYLEEELQIKIRRKQIYKTFNGSTFLIGHGDGLGPGDYGYKIIKKVFASSVCQFLFARLHPNFAIRLARFLSGSSRSKKSGKEAFVHKDKEWLVQYCEQVLKNKSVDYFIFGHRHIPLDIKLKNGFSRYINLGDWVNHYTYARYDGQKMELLTYTE